MKLKTKFKKYFTEKPKSNFWRLAFITLFLFKWVTPTVLIFISMFQLGLITPDLDPSLMDSMYQKTAENLANIYVSSFYKMFEAGQVISQNNAIIGRILFYALSYMIWVIWGMMIILILNLLRFGILGLYWKIKNKSKLKRKEWED